MQKPHKKYPLHQCPIYKLSSKARLAHLLFIEKSKLESLSKLRGGNYKFFEAGKRAVQVPKSVLERIHRRLLYLFSRLEIPEYLHSATKFKSYETNAEAHLANENESVVKIDIKSFYRSIPWYRVFLFFNDSLKCSEDVSTILTNLVTVDIYKSDSCLPTGSCLSPLLSFLVNWEMFDEIDASAKSRGVTMTLYVDDLTFSGNGADGNLLKEVRAILLRYRYLGHKLKTYPQAGVKVITGLALKGGRLRVPTKRIVRIHQDLKRLKGVTNLDERIKFLRSLIGRLQEASRFESKYLSARNQLYKELDLLEIRKIQQVCNFQGVACSP